MLPPALARADLIGSINTARAQGCGGQPGVRAPLRSSPKLNMTARLMSRGKSLRDALATADYHSVQSSSVHMSGSLMDADIVRIFSGRFCDSLRDPSLREIGYYRSGREIRFVLAQPFSSLPLKDADAVNRRVLQLVNDARSHRRRCGQDHFAPARPLTLNRLLYTAALEHSRDMAQHDYFAHEGRDNTLPSQRIAQAGYRWRVTGENLAAGVTTPEEAVQGWLDSPHHCANLMDPRFTETATAFALAPHSTLGIYWTQVFALPR